MKKLFSALREEGKLPFDPNSLRFRLTLVFVLLVILPALTIMATNVLISLNSGLERAFVHLETVTRLKEESIEKWVEHLETNLSNTHEAKELRWHISVLTGEDESVQLFRQVSFNRVKAALDRTLSETQNFDEVFLLDKSGNVVMSTPIDRSNHEFGKNPFFIKGINKFTIQIPFRFSASDGYSVLAFRPVNDANGKHVGVIAGRTNISRLGQLLRSREGLGNTGKTFLVDNDGVLLTPPIADILIGETVSRSYNTLEFSDGNSIRERTENYHKVKTISVQHWLPSLNVVLVAEQAESEAFSSIYTALSMSVIVTIIALLIAISLGIYLTKNITEPLKELSLTAAKITAGDIHTVATVRGSTELVHLAKIFNTMTTRLRDLITQLKRSEQQQRDLLNNTSSVIYIKAPDGRYLFINRKYEELINISESIVCGKTDHEIHSPEIANNFQSHDQQVIASDSILEFEETVHQSDGEHTYISVKFPLKNETGEIYAVCGISTDITSRKKQEEELKKLRNYLYNIINSMPSILVGVDCEGKVTQWNTQAEKSSGIARSDALGQLLTLMLPDLEIKMEQVFRAINTRKKISDHARLLNVNGVEHFQDITIFPLVENGIEGAVIRVDDVTERLRIEEMMIQSDKMLSVGGLAAGMAHEINNPLGGIMQTSEVMIERLTSEMSANVRAAKEIGIDLKLIHAYMKKRSIPRMLNTIRDSGRRASTIVGSMLGFSRQSHADFSNHDIVELLEQTITLSQNDYNLKTHYDFKQIEIVRDFEKKLPLISCEPQKVQQVLLNIIKNGAESMLELKDGHYQKKLKGKERKPPCLTLSLRNISENNMVRIEITDNGMGMEEDVRKRVFDPFFSTKPAGVGTGLGLSVSYFIITENLAGTLSVKSKLGVGTSFIICLPSNLVEKNEQL